MNRKTNIKPILVTGSHHSGTTWVGKMIAASGDVGYVHEPFNPIMCVGKSHFKLWYTYVTQENQSEYYPIIADSLNFNYHLIEEVKNFISLKDLGHIFIEQANFWKYKITGKRTLMKDPIALFSSEWLYNTFNMDVIVMIRHPAAFIGSLKKGNSTHPFDHYLNQEQLMRDYLEPFREELIRYTENEYDVIDQGILSWNIIHYTILKFREKYGNKWIFLKHEDASVEPLKTFKDIYSKLGLTFDSQVSNKILSFSSSDNRKSIVKTTIQRDSKSNVFSWKKRLTVDEIERIKLGTHKISSIFYNENEW